MKNDQAKLKIGLRQSGQRLNSGLLLAVSVFVLVFASGLAITQTVFATHGPGPTPSDVSCTICPDNDKDGYRAYCDTSHVFDKSFGCGYGPPPDCNDADPWSHSYGSKDIASVKVEYAPAYVAKTQTDKKFTPDSKKLNPTLGDLLITVTFKAKKCGMAVTPDVALMNVSYTTKDSSGNEISSWLLLQGAPGLGKPGNLYRVSDLVYRGTILTYGGDPRFFPANLEPYISSVAAGRSVQLKFVGPDIGPNKDTPKYASLPMTNCAQVYGSGKHKVVYMRTNGAGLNMNYFGALSDQVVFYGFNAIEPFKAYKTQFSHFLDLKSHPIVAADAINVIKDNKDSSFVRTSSSCGQFSSLYFLFDKIPFDVGPFVARFYNRVVFMDTNYLNEESHAVETGPIAIHEAGHAFAGLMDEYPYFLRNTGVWRTYLYKKADSGSNCSSIPSINYSYLSRMYGRLDAKICSLDTLFRPSMNSLMMGNKRNGENRFNVISCGYILKFIKKDGLAKTYFPECAAMAARDGSIIPVGQ